MFFFSIMPLRQTPYLFFILVMECIHGIMQSCAERENITTTMRGAFHSAFSAPAVARAEGIQSSVSHIDSASIINRTLTVNQLATVMNNSFNRSFLLQVVNRSARKTSINFETFYQDRSADESESGNFLQNSVIVGFVKNDRVLCLVLDLSLRPFLLLCFTTPARCWRCRFCFGLQAFRQFVFYQNVIQH